MSHTVPSHHPAVVRRSNYQLVRSLLAVAIAVILGLTVAVVVLATSSNQSTRANLTQSVIHANPSAETGARLDHSGRHTTAPQPSVSNYPDAPQSSAGTSQASVSNYPDAPSPSLTTLNASVSDLYPDAPQP